MSHIVPAIPAPQQPIHLRPATEAAERALLTGDPQRALAIARELLHEPRPFNMSRGLWGYTGRAPDGAPVTVQSTGMGGPSAAIVVEELIGLGVRTLVRTGTCGALGPELELGELIVAAEVVPADGASRALGAGERVRADAGLTEALVAAGGGRRARVVSSDLFYDPADPAPGWRAEGIDAVEMEAATVLRVAERHGVRAGCVLGVSDVLAEGRRRIEPDPLEELGIRLGEVALRALAETPRTTEAPARPPASGGLRTP